MLIDNDKIGVTFLKVFAIQFVVLGVVLGFLVFI